MQSRSIPLLGADTIAKLRQQHIAIFGLGGVGGYVAEALARVGVEEFTLVDFDVINVSNKNRQIIALDSTIGKLKVEAMKERLSDINKEITTHLYQVKIDEKTIEKIPLDGLCYIVDCIDDVKGKLAIIKKAKEKNIPIISCCGTGNKLNPLAFQIKDINQTSVCPLAKKLRQESKKLDIKNFDVLFSTEEPLVKDKTISSVSFVPSVAGLLIARHITLKIKEA